MGGLVKDMGVGISVVLHKKEVPPPTVMVKGARSFKTVPSRIEVKGKVMPTTMPKEEALAIQKDTMEHYQDPLMKAQLKQLQAKMLEKWLANPEGVDNPNQREYNVQLRSILQRQQAKFFPKHGFEPTTKGMTLMQALFNNYLDD